MKGLFNKNLKKQTLLLKTLDKFSCRSLQPKIGIELEFYLQKHNLPASSQETQQFISKLNTELLKHNIDILAIESEQGSGQIEIKTLPYLDILKLCHDIENIKEITSKLDSNFQANFSSQPYPDDCGSSLQINFSLMKNNHYFFAKDGQLENKNLLHCIWGVLKNIKNMMIIFVPTKQDYQRINLETNRALHKKQKFTAPVNISWGYENRTTLIRIPKEKNSSERRLEFRLACNSADIYLAILFFLIAILEGLDQKQEAPKEIYGNAFDDQYELERLPSYEEAKSYFNEKHLIKTIFC